jgi:hypothetical protein
VQEEEEEEEQAEEKIISVVCEVQLLDLSWHYPG